MKDLAPIVLFTYNRIAHTKQTIEALAKNELAKESKLFIYSDGYKNDTDKIQVLEVRKYLENISGFKNITIIEQNKNLGLANSIILGVTDIINKYGKIIVLEDDIVTSPYFLDYMNKSLHLYEKEKKVWHISAWNYPIEQIDNQDTFLWRVMNCWGWATWKDKWIHYEKDTNKLISSFSNEDIHKFNLDNTYNFWKQVLDNEAGLINTWAIFWYATIFKHNGLCLNPARTFVDNIGFGYHATNCKNIKNYTDYLNEQEVIFTKDLIEDKKYLRKVKQYMNNINKLGNNKRFSDEDYKLLQNTPRFTEVSVSFFDNKIKIPDSASSLFLNRELFGLEIYKFETDKNNPLIIDCGANIGFSIIYFKTLYPNSKIIAFEPDQKIFEYLTYNINSFDFGNIELINKGLWKEKTTLKFYSEGADGGRIAIENDMNNIIQIETVKLSKYLQNNEVDFLKIDIEGAETEVLFECQDELKNVKNLFIEYHSFANEKQTLSIILDILEKNDFRYYIDRTSVKSNHPFCNISTYEGFDNQLNIFGYRK